MSTKMFQSACAALWRPQYRSPGARELGIGLRSMVRYGTERSVPPILMARLGKLLKQRQTIDRLLLAAREVA